MTETLFYICGAVVVASGILTALLAMTNSNFPGPLMVPLVGWFAVFGIAAVVFAIAHGNSEKTEQDEISYTIGGKAPEEEAPAGEGAEEGEAMESQTPEEGEESGEGMEEAGGEGAETASAGGDPMAGSEVFSENCSTCHGATGHGGNGGPDLTTMPLAQSEEGAIEQVTNGGGGMPAFGGTLSEEEIENVAAYVAQEITHGE
jgi:cytochrome c551